MPAARHSKSGDSALLVRLSGTADRRYTADANRRAGDARAIGFWAMDQSVELNAGNRRLAAERLRDFIVTSVDAATASDTPFYHLVLDRVFPDDVYAAMLANMPDATDYRPMHGRSKGHDLTDGTHTRVKIDVFPEYIRHLPPQKRAVWDIVGRALCSAAVRDAFIRRLKPALERRFGPGYAKIGMYPIPVLTRDIPGYLITPHTDTRWKGITVQLYLPRDSSITHIGTIFHDKRADGSCGPKAKANDLCAKHRLRLRRGHRYLALGRSGRTRGQNPRQHSFDLFRRCWRAALPAQPRQAAGQFHRQRNPQSVALSTSVSRALRSTERRAVVRCRPGIVTDSEFATIPDQRRTAIARRRRA